MNKKDTTRERMRKIFKKFDRSQAWAARTIGVSPVTISRYLSGHIVSKRLDHALPPLADLLIATGGKCVGVDGPPARHAVNRMRGQRKGSK